MRVLFVVQGEGRGHLMQAIAVSRMLKSAGHDVVEVLVGKSCGRVIPQFFYEQIGAPVHCFDSPNFMPTVRNQRPPLLRSVAYNIVRLPRYALSVRFIYQRIRAGRVDMVLNFYELLTGMLYFFCRPSASHVCVGHQLLFLHRDFRFPGANRLSWCSLKLFTWMASFGAERKLALSFREMPDDESHDIFVVPPLLRREVVTARPSDGRYIHGYMVNAGFSESVEAWHRQHPEVELHFSATAVATVEQSASMRRSRSTPSMTVPFSARSVVVRPMLRQPVSSLSVRPCISGSLCFLCLHILNKSAMPTMLR